MKKTIQGIKYPPPPQKLQLWICHWQREDRMTVKTAFLIFDQLFILSPGEGKKLSQTKTVVLTLLKELK